METDSNSELGQFHRFLGDKLSNGAVDLSPEDVLDEWRNLHPEKGELDDDVAAIQAALDDLDNGVVGMPLAEFDRKVRRKLKMQEPLEP